MGNIEFTTITTWHTTPASYQVRRNRVRSKNPYYMSPPPYNWYNWTTTGNQSSFTSANENTHPTKNIS